MLAQATKKHHAANPPMDTAESKAARSGALPSMASSSSVTQAPRRRDPHCAMAHLDHRRSWPLDSHVLRQLPSRRHPPRPADYLFVSLFTAAPQSALQWECSCSAPVQHSLAAGCSNPHRKLGCASRTPALRRAPQVTLRRTPRSYLAKFSRWEGRLQVVRTCPSRVHPPQYTPPHIFACDAHLRESPPLPRRPSYGDWAAPAAAESESVFLNADQSRLGAAVISLNEPIRHKAEVGSRRSTKNVLWA